MADAVRGYYMPDNIVQSYCLKRQRFCHHCVGNYIPQVADGSTVILFIRRKSAPDKPYVTVEVKNDKVVQIRGFDNRVPESDVVDFVEQFKHSKCIA